MVCLWTVGCGQGLKKATPTDQAVAPRYGMLMLDDPHIGDFTPGRLRFRSFKRDYLTVEISLGIKLGWLGFGTSVKVGTEFHNQSSGGVLLSKIPEQEDSGIFLNDGAVLDVRLGEEFQAECFYDGSISLKYDGHADISLAGTGIQGSGGSGKIMGMEVISKSFDVQPGDDLQRLESYCETLFESQYRNQVNRDLSRAVKSQLVIRKHFDPSIQALENILLGRKDVIIRGRRLFDFSGVVSEQPNNSGAIRVRGLLNIGHGGSRGRALDLDHLYSKKPMESDTEETRLQLESSALVPRAVDDEYGEALVVAGYVARNQAEYAHAVKLGKPFQVDKTLLHSL